MQNSTSRKYSIERSKSNSGQAASRSELQVHKKNLNCKSKFDEKDAESNPTVQVLARSGCKYYIGTQMTVQTTNR